MMTNKESEAVCDYCGTSFLRKRYKLLSAEKHFCNNKCKYLYRYQPGEKNTLGVGESLLECMARVIEILKQIPKARIKEVHSKLPLYKARQIRSALARLVRNKIANSEKIKRINYYFLTNKDLD